MNNISTNRKHILFLPSAIGLSHLVRLIRIACELHKMNLEIAFAFKEKNKILKHYNFKVFQVTDVTVNDFSSNVFEGFHPALIEQCVEDELSAIREFKPDAIVGDFRHTAAISARIAKIPFISVVNACVTDYFNPVELMIPRKEKPLKHRFASFSGRIIQRAQKRSLALHFRTAAKKYGIKNLDSIDDFLKGDLTLIADLPQFCALKHLPENYKYIGPLIWEGLKSNRSNFSRDLNNSKKLIYATTGNTGKEKLIQLVFDAFKNDRSYELVLTTGEYLNPTALPKASNIRMERFIPGSEILPHCHAAIHCGGSGTTYQVLSHGVPSLVLPFNNDQKINAWLVKRNKVGIAASPENLTGAHVHKLVDLLIHDKNLMEHLEYYQNLLRDPIGPKTAASEIISFLTNK